ncbi:MAG: protein kinase [Phascolarctobacterium sp.]|nr:protein kinase [Phascolarctobacterium sp.]
MGHAAAFILQKYTVLKTLKESALGTTELVLGRDQKVYVRKCLNNAAYPVEAVRGLKHENLSHIIHAVAAEDKAYLVEEYFEGETLDVLLKKKGCLDERSVIAIAEQVCEALLYLHKHDLVHRDVKPANILRQSNGQIRLIDLGSVRLCTAHEAGDTVALGTQGYAAPEQYGLETTDFRADVYALGVTLKELLGAGYEGRLNEVIDGCTRFMRGYRYDNIAKVKRALFFAKYYNSLRMGVLVLLVAVLSMGAYFYFLPAPVKPLPVSKPVEKALPAAETKTQEAKPTPEARPTETLGKSNTETSTKAQAEQTKPVVPPKETNQSQAKLQLDMKAANLSFYKSVEHPSDKMLIDEAKSKGAWPINSKSSTALPVWEIIAKGELVNPVCTFKFHGIAFKGRNMQYGDSMSKKSWSVDNPGGWSSTVRLEEKGTMASPSKLYLVNVHKWFWFTSAANPSVTVTVQADNAETIIREYPVTISDF